MNIHQLNWLIMTFLGCGNFYQKKCARRSTAKSTIIQTVGITMRRTKKPSK